MSVKIALAVAPENALASAFVVFRDRLDVCIRKAAELGYDGVELALLHKEQVDLGQIKNLIKETNIEIPMISTGQIFADTGVSFTSSKKEERKKAVVDFSGLMEIAAELGSMINIGRLRGGLVENEPSEKYFMECMETILKKAEELDVTVALETVNRYETNFLNSCDECANVIDQLAHQKLVMMPDVFHMNIEDPSIEGAIWRHADKIDYIHFADSNRWAPGRGHLDFHSIIGALKTVNFTGYVSVEILPYPDPDQAAEEAINVLRRYL